MLNGIDAALKRRVRWRRRKHIDSKAQDPAKERLLWSFTKRCAQRPPQQKQQSIKQDHAKPIHKKATNEEATTKKITKAASCVRLLWSMCEGSGLADHISDLALSICESFVESLINCLHSLFLSCCSLGLKVSKLGCDLRPRMSWW